MKMYFARDYKYLLMSRYCYKTIINFYQHLTQKVCCCTFYFVFPSCILLKLSEKRNYYLRICITLNFGKMMFVAKFITCCASNVLSCDIFEQYTKTEFKFTERCEYCVYNSNRVSDTKVDKPWNT
jgi:hypothetical protein